MDCKHKIVFELGDRTTCMLCKVALKFNQDTRLHEAVDKPEQPEFHDKVADRLHNMIVGEVKPLSTTKLYGTSIAKLRRRKGTS